MLTLTLDVFGQKHHLGVSDDPKGIGVASCQYLEEAAQNMTIHNQRNRMYVQLALDAAMKYVSLQVDQDEQVSQQKLHIDQLCDMIEGHLARARTILRHEAD